MESELLGAAVEGARLFIRDRRILAMMRYDQFNVATQAGKCRAHAHDLDRTGPPARDRGIVNICQAHEDLSGEAINEAIKVPYCL